MSDQEDGTFTGTRSGVSRKAPIDWLRLCSQTARLLAPLPLRPYPWSTALTNNYRTVLFSQVSLEEVSADQLLTYSFLFTRVAIRYRWRDCMLEAANRAMIYAFMNCTALGVSLMVRTARVVRSETQEIVQRSLKKKLRAGEAVTMRGPRW